VTSWVGIGGVSWRLVLDMLHFRWWWFPAVGPGGEVLRTGEGDEPP
jgi:hypothetical protein